MSGFHSIEDLGSLDGKRALVRVDLNVPMQDGKVTDFTRIDALKPTVKLLIEKGATVVLLSHFGRPKGKREPEMSLMKVVEPLRKSLGVDITFIADCVGPQADAAIKAASAPLLVLENLRYHAGEEANDAQFAAALAKNGDIYVNDAFSCAHRAHASTAGITKLLPSYAGCSMIAELTALHTALSHPQKPVAAVVGGAKVSSKLDVLLHLIDKVDHLIIGGGMANTFLAAQGHDVAASLCEFDLADTANKILAKASKENCAVHLPTDVVVAKEFRSNAPSRSIELAEVNEGDMILDVGPNSVKRLIDILATCRTLIWNGPLGAFELTPFDRGTVELAQAAAQLTSQGTLVTVAGGGDTVSALAHAGVKEKFTHVSTAGGAFLEWMEGKELPGVKALAKSH